MNEEVVPSREVAIDAPAAPWRRPPFVQSWATAADLPRRTVRLLHAGASDPGPPWVDSGPAQKPFDVTAALSELMFDVCRHVAEFRHIDPARILVTILQARHPHGHGLQARVTPLRFPGGHLVRTARGRVHQVQRFIVAGVEMLYVMTFSMPRFLDRSFDDKMVTLFHELFHIGQNFDGDLRRHRGRCSLHTASQAAYDAHMAQLARAYLAGGANPRRHDFLRLTCGQLQARHGRVVGVMLPRVKILPLLLE